MRKMPEASVPAATLRVRIFFSLCLFLRTEGLLAVLVPSCWCGNLGSPWGPNAALKTGLQQTCTTRHL